MNNNEMDIIVCITMYNFFVQARNEEEKNVPSRIILKYSITAVLDMFPAKPCKGQFE